MSKKVTVSGTDYVLHEVKTGDAKRLRREHGGSEDFNIGLVANSLGVSPAEVEDMPYYGVFLPLFTEAMALNGLSPAGEATAAPGMGAA